MTLSAQDFELLLQANRILSSKLNVDEVLQAVLELATKVVKAEASSLLLLDEKKNELVFNVALGEVGDQVKQIRIKVGEGVAGWVAKEQRPLIVNDVSKDPRFTKKVDKSTSFVTKSILAVPVRAKGRLIGVVEAINKENDQKFTTADQEAFGVFSSQAGIAIENARLFTDVTTEKKKLNTVVSEMSDGVVVFDENQKIVLVNQACCRFMGWTAEDMVGKKYTPNLFDGFSMTPPVKNLTDIHSELHHAELGRKEPKEFYLSARIHRVKPVKEGGESGWMVILHDITEEKRTGTLKSDFLSLISHKLKTPLTVIIGYTPTLLSQEEGLTDFQKKAIKAIKDQGEHLSGLVEKLLRFTIVESDNLKRTTTPQKLQALLERAKDDVNGILKKGDVDFHMMPLESGFPDVLVDGNLTIEVFKNLIENAIKFNDKKNKKVNISVDKNGQSVSIHVEDNGMGIPPEEQERVFEKFYQIENNFTGQIPGAGLGLALCKKVVDQMGGNIRISSHVKKGTTVTVQLPCS